MSIETRVREELTSALSRATGQDLRIAVTVDDSPPPWSRTIAGAGVDPTGAVYGDVDDDVDDDPEPAAWPTGKSLSGVNTERDARLNPKTSSTASSPGEQPLRAPAAVAVSEVPARAYNPLFIYGESGLGKDPPVARVGHYTSSLFPAPACAT